MEEVLYSLDKLLDFIYIFNIAFSVFSVYGCSSAF